MTLTLDVAMCDTIGSVKAKVQDITAVPPHQMRLVSGGNLLDDRKTIADYGCLGVVHVLGEDQPDASNHDWVDLVDGTVLVDIPTSDVGTNDPSRITAELLAAMFPAKDAAKRAAWLQTLLDAEFEALNQLKDLREQDWDRLELPLAVKLALRMAASKSAEAEAETIVAPSPPRPPVAQIDIIVIDVSGSMRASSSLDQLKTREDASKILFHTLVDKLIGLELNHALGIVAFGETITTIPVTREYERFHDELGRLDANQGSTKLYDGLFAAAQMLESYIAAAHAAGAPPPKKRIFVLTDGEDNASNHAPWQVTQYMQKNEIVCDCIPLAGDSSILHAVCTASGGMCFNVVSEQQGSALFEREPVLHLASREQPAEKPRAVEDLSSFQAFVDLGKRTCPVDHIQKIESKMLHAPVLKPADVAASISVGSASSSLKRILREYKQIADNPGIGLSSLGTAATWSVFVCANNVHNWKAVLQGLPAPYLGGCYLVTISIPADYPCKPPRINFETPIYHPNINADGRICLDVLKDAWSPTLSIATLLSSVLNLVLTPNSDDPLDVWKAELFRVNPAQYYGEAQKHTTDHASESFDALSRRCNLTEP
jgi:ubiquitin-conjugating enzyme E2 D/E